MTMAARALTLTHKLQARYFRAEDHPYRIYEAVVRRRIGPSSVLLDAGCGSTGEVVARLSRSVARSIGVDVVPFRGPLAGSPVHLMRNDLGAISLKSGSVDCVISRSVMEHLKDPLPVYRELYRVLKPGGSFVFLTPNLWDYGSLISKAIPNSLHPWLVRKVEGRNEDDTFPAFYQSNTAGAIGRLAAASGFKVESIRYLGQYPCYLRFNALLFLLGTAYEKVTSRFEALRYLRGWLLAVLDKPAI